MIPKEIVEFFNNKGGHSLLIKGEPGSGKTTFALELLNKFREQGEVLYISTRVADSVIGEQFPWVTSIVPAKKKVRKKLKRENLNRLEGLIEEGFVKESILLGDTEAIIEVGELLPELEKIYEFVEKSGSKSMICIDSIDGLSERYGIPPEKILFTLQKDIVEEGRANAIFVLEETSTEKIDYLGDGIVHLTHEPLSGFWRRVMIITKLRGAIIKRPRYLYTLEGGRFGAISYRRFSLDRDNVQLIDLKEIVKGPWQPGAINMRVSSNFPGELLQSLMLSIIAESEGEVLIVPPAFYAGDSLETHAQKFTGKKVKVVGYGSERREMYLEGRDMLVELSPDIVQYHGGEHATIIIAVDSMANIYGNLQDLPSLIKNLKFNHRIVLFTPEEYKIAGGVDYGVNLDMIEDIPVVIGSGAYGICTSEENDTVKLKLVPLL